MRFVLNLLPRELYWVIVQLSALFKNNEEEDKLYWWHTTSRNFFRLNILSMGTACELDSLLHVLRVKYRLCNGTQKWELTKNLFSILLYYYSDTTKGKKFFLRSELSHFIDMDSSKRLVQVHILQKKKIRSASLPDFEDKTKNHFHELKQCLMVLREKRKKKDK